MKLLSTILFLSIFSFAYSQISPDEIDSLQAWYIASPSTVIMESDSSVSQLTDQSGNGLHVSQSTASSKPVLTKTNELNNQYTVQFDGIDDYLDGGDILDVTQSGQSIFIVGKANNNGAFYAKAKQGTGNAKYALFYNLNFLSSFYYDNSNRKIIGSNNIGKFELANTLFDLENGVHKLFQNYILIDSLEIIKNFNMNSEYEFIVGAYNNNVGSFPPSTFILNGNIAEIIIYHKCLIEQERLQVENYLNGKYFPNNYCPTVSLPNDTIIEYGFCPISIDAGNIYASYLWNTGDTTATILAHKRGMYSVTVTDSFGLQSADTIHVTFPKFNETDTVVCAGDSVLLDVQLSSDYTYVWNTGEITQTIYAKDEALYRCAILDSLGCDTIAQFNIAIDSLQYDIYAPTDTSLCKNNVLCIEVDTTKYSNTTFKWNNENLDQCINIDTAGTYVVTITDNTGCIVEKSTNVSISGEAPVIHFSIDNVCTNELTQFTESVNCPTEIINYEWSFSNGNSSNEQNPTIHFQDSASYTAALKATEVNGCSAEDSMDFHVYTPLKSLINVHDACINQYVYFNNMRADTSIKIIAQNWLLDNSIISNRENDSSFFDTSGSFDLTLLSEDEHHCVDTASKSITIFENLPVPKDFSASFPPNNAILYSDSIYLKWQKSENAAMYNVIVAKDSTFTEILLEEKNITETHLFSTINYIGNCYWKVEALNICGDITASATHTFSITPFWESDKPSMWLVADSAETVNGKVIQWNDINDSLFVLNPNEISQPLLGINEINGHSALLFSGGEYLNGGDILDITSEGYSIFIVGKVNNSGAYYAKANPSGLPQRHSLFFNSETNYSYLYHDSENKKIVGNINNSGSFNLLSIDINNDIDSIFIIEFEDTISSQFIDNEFDMNSEYHFVIGGLNNTLGTDPDLLFLDGAIAEFIVYQKSLQKNERLEIEQYLRYKYFPDSVISPVYLGPDIFIEYGFADTLIEIADVYESYQWSTGSDSSSIRVDTTGIYSVTVTDRYGIESFDDIYIEYPKVKIDNQNICLHDSIPLYLPFSTKNYNLLWSNGETFDTIYATSNATWQVTVTDSLGNSFISLLFTTTIDEFPKTSLIPHDTTFCAGNTIIPYINEASISAYSWSGGSLNYENVITADGDYILSVTNGNGCVAIDTVTVSLKGIAPVPQIHYDTVCFGNQTALTDMSTTNALITTREWYIDDTLYSSADSMISPIISSAGKHAVQLYIKNANECDNATTDTIIVGEIPKADFVLSRGNFGCTSADVMLNQLSSTEQDSIIATTWYFNDSIRTEYIPAFTFPEIGTHSVALTVETEFGCTDSIIQSINIFKEHQLIANPYSLHPQNNAVFDDESINFQWIAPDSVNLQILQVATDSLLNSVEEFPFAGNITETTILFESGKQYWWRVKAFNTCKDSTVSEIQSFTIINPLNIQGATLWLSADTLVEIDTLGKIVNWNDRVSGKQMYQAIQANRPALHDSAVNSISFDGKNDFLKGENLYVDEKENSIFIVHKYSGARINANQYLLNQNASTGNKYSIRSIANSNFRTVYDVYPPNGGTLGGISYGSLYYRLTSIASGGGNSTLYTNGEVNASNISEDYTGVETEFIIGNRNSSSFDGWFAGDIAEIIIYNRKLDDDERILVEQYLFTKYKTLSAELGPDISISNSVCDTTLHLKNDYLNYAWSNGSTDTTISVLWPNTYSVTVTDNFGMQSSDDIIVTRDFSQLSDTMVCIGNTVTLQPSIVSDYSYKWHNGSTANSINIISTTTASLTITDNDGCSLAYNPIQVTVDRFTLTAGFEEDTLFLCTGDTLFATDPVDVNANYEWHDGSSNYYYIANANEEVYVTISNANECSKIDSVYTLIQGSPLLSDFTFDTVCYGGSSTLSALSTPVEDIGTQTWIVNQEIIGTGNSIVHAFSEFGNFSVTLVDTSAYGCVGTVSKSILVNEAPNANIGSESLCASNTIILQDSSTFINEEITAWTWYENQTEIGSTQNIDYTPNDSNADTISFVVENAIGCTDSATKIIEMVSDYYTPAKFQLLTPAEDATISDTIIAFSWQPATNAYVYAVELSETLDFTTFQVFETFDTSIELNVDAGKKYYWRVIAYNVCNDSAISNIQSFSTLPASLFDNLLCWFDASKNITADADGFVSSWQSANPTAYSVSAPNADSRPRLKLNQLNGYATVAFDGLNDYLYGNTLSLNSLNNTVILVHRFNEVKTSGLNTLFNVETTSGSKQLLYSLANSNNTIKAQSYPPETAPAGTVEYGNDYFFITSVISDSSVTTIWSNSALNATATSKDIQEVETKLLIGAFSESNLENCFSGEIAEILVFDSVLTVSQKESIETYLFNKYAPQPDLGDDIDYSLCQTSIGVPNIYKGYTWHNGETTSSIFVEDSGKYTLNVVDAFGRIQKDSISILRPTLQYPDNYSICLNDSLLWDCGFNSNYSIEWNTGSADSSIIIKNPDNYSVAITDSLGCSLQSDEIAVSIDSFANNIVFVARPEACNGEILFVDDPENQISKYVWSTGNTSKTQTVSTSGTYAVTVSDSVGCSVSFSQDILVSGEAPIITLNDKNICSWSPKILSVTTETALSDSVETISWNIQNYATQYGDSVEYIFKTTASVPIQVYAETSLGCKGTLLDTIVPLKNDLVNINLYGGDVACTGTQLYFESTSENANSYTWQYHTATIGNNATVLQTASAVGIDSISLLVEHSNLCQQSETHYFTVVSSSPQSSAFTLLSPSDKTQINIDDINIFTWNASENTQYYTIEFAHDSLFSSIAYTETYIEGTIFEYASLQGGNLFWRIKAHSPCNNPIISNYRSIQILSPLTSVAPMFWVNADHQTVLEDSLVGTWQPILGPTPLQTDSSAMPRLKSNAINGHPALVFDGLNDYLNLGDTLDIGADGQTILLIGKYNDVKETFIAKSKSAKISARNAVLVVNNELQYLYQDDVDRRNLGWERPFDYNFITIRNKNNISELFNFSTFYSSIDISPDFNMESSFDFLIGAYNNTTGTVPPNENLFLNGEIAEILVYNTSLNDSLLDIVHDYLLKKYFPTIEFVDLGEDIVLSNSFCPVELTTNKEFASYKWNTGEVSSSIFVQESGMYNVTVSNESGITSSDSVKVTFPGTESTTAFLCNGSTIDLEPDIDGDYNYIWLSGETDSIKTVSTAGNFIAIVTDNVGCSKEFYFQVILDDNLDNVYLPSDTIICKNNEIGITAPSSIVNSLSYEWSTGETSNAIIIDAEGQYSVTVSNDNCSVVKTVNILFKGTAPIIDFSTDRLCEKKPIQFTDNSFCESEITSYGWIFGNNITSDEQNPLIQFDNEGMHPLSVMVTEIGGCISVMYDTVKINPLPIGELTIDDACIALPSSINLILDDSSSVQNITWDFDNGDSQTGYVNEYSYTNEGTYIVSSAILDSLQCETILADTVQIFTSLLNPNIAYNAFPDNYEMLYQDSIPFSWEGSAHHFIVKVYEDSLKNYAVHESEPISENSLRISLPYIDTLYWEIESYNLCEIKVTSPLFTCKRFSPATIKNNQFWLIADSIKNKTLVDSWQSISSGLQVIQTDSALMPLIKERALNNHASIAFDGIDDYLNGEDILDIETTGQTVFIVANNKNNKASFYAKSLQGNTPKRYALYYSAGDLYYLYHDVSIKRLLNKVDVTDFEIYSVNVNPNNEICSVRKGGSHIASASIAADFDMNNNFYFLLGAYNNDKGTFPVDGLHLDGEIAEFIVFNRSLNETEQKSIEKYLRYKYFPEKIIEPVDLGNDIVVEYGFCPIIIDASDQYENYEWNTGAISSKIEITSSGTYAVTVADAYGEVSVDSITITYPVQKNNNATVCAGDSIQIGPELTGNYTYLWDNDSATQYLFVKEASNQSILITDSLNCSAYISYSVTIDSFPLAVSVPDSIVDCKWSALCSGYNKTKYPNVVSIWNNTDTVSCAQLFANGYYTIRAIDKNGCEFNDSTFVEIQGEAPIVNFSLSTACEDAITISENNTSSATPIIDYRWFVNDSLISQEVSPSIVFTKNGATEIKLEVSEEGGCIGTQIETVEVLQSSSMSLAVEDACFGSPSAINFMFDSVFSVIDSSIWKISDATFYNENPESFVAENAGTILIQSDIFDDRGCHYHLQDSAIVYESYPMPEAFSIISPTDNASLDSNNISFSWHKSQNAFAYSLFIVNAQNEIIYQIANSKDTSVHVSIAYKDTLYCFVSAQNICNDITYSDTIAFSVFNPLLITNAVGWFVADSIQSTDSVSQWVNLANADMSIYANAKTNTPLVKPDMLNHHAVVQFDGIDDYLDGKDIFDASSIFGRSFFIVSEFEKNPSSFISKSLTGNSQNRFFVLIDDLGKIRLGFHDNELKNVISKGSLEQNEYLIYSGMFDFSNKQASLYQNTNNIGNVEINQPINSTYNFLVGAYNNEQGTIPPKEGYYLDGSIAEIIIYDQALTDEERTKVDNYLLKKYFPEYVHDTFALAEQHIVPHGYCPTEIAIQEEDWMTNITWSNGATTPAASVDTSGWYYVSVTDELGKIFTDSIEVIYEGYPNTVEGKKFCYGQSLLWDTKLDNAYDFNWSNGATTSFITISETGNYSVTITDSTGCSKSFGPILVDVDEFFLEASLGADTSLCIGNKIFLKKGAETVAKYLWSTGDTTEMLVMNSAGTYSIITENINNCIAYDTINIAIHGTAPTIDFSITNHCEADTIYFKDASTLDNADITSWKWSFNNTEIISPNFDTIIDSSGTYNIQLALETSETCKDSVVKEFPIYPLPDASFGPLVGCILDSIQFTSVLYADTTLSHVWKLQEGNEYEPYFTEYFDTSGIYTIEHFVISKQGCSHSVIQDITIKPTPIANFSYTLPCEGERVAFFNTTVTESFNPVVSYYWMINNAKTEIGILTYSFDSVGHYPIELTIRSLNGCTHTKKDTIYIAEKPMVNFLSSNYCEDDTLLLIDSSIVNTDIIDKYEWITDSIFIGNSKSESEILPVGKHIIKLTATTDNGCSSTVLKAIEIYPKPITEFTFSPQFGGAPLQVRFENKSDNADSYFWYVNQDTIQEFSPEYLFTDSGSYTITLIAETEHSCRDSISKQIFVGTNNYQVEIFDITIVNESGFVQTNIVCTNIGTVPIYKLEFILQLANDATIKEQWEGVLQPGESMNYTITSQVQIADDLPFACIDAQIVDEMNTVLYSEQFCKSFTSNFELLGMYPNPVKDILTVDYSLPNAGTVQFTIYDQSGKILSDKTYENQQVGFNTLHMNVANLANSVYTYSITFNSESITRRFVKQSGE